jgi:hypothetical protein
MWKAVRWYLLVAVVAVAGGFLLGRAGTGATAAEKKSADSLAAVARATDSLVALAKQTQAREDSIAADSIRKAKARVIVLRGKTDTAWLPLDTATVTAPLRAQLDAAHHAQLAERKGDSTLIAALEADTLLKRRHADSAWALLGTVTAQRNEAQRQLATALGRRTEPPVTLGATLGPGCLLTGGRVVCGYAGANAGLTVRIKIPLPKFLGG